MLAPIAVAAATIAGCPLFPSSWSTNQRVDTLPVAPDSAAIVRSIGVDGALKADFGSGLWEGGPIGIPYDVVTRRTRRSSVRFEYSGESDRVRYPIPRGVHIEGGPDADGDRHALLVDRNRCKLFELYALRKEGGGWTAGSGATWSLRKPRLRPSGWTSADAAGLPILPLLARYPEVRRGRITHALRMTVSDSRRAFVFPARHFASSDSDPALPRMGERLRLKAADRHLRPARAGARGRAGDEGVRADRGRQRLGLVRLRRAAPAVGQRRAAAAAPPARSGLRGRAGRLREQFRNETLAFRISVLYGCRVITKRSCFVSELYSPGGPPDARRRHSRSAPLVDAGRALLLPAGDRARQHDPQRRAPDPPDRPRCKRLAASMDRRLLHAGVRRRAADGRRARGSLRAQEGAHVRPRSSSGSAPGSRPSPSRRRC